MSKFINITGANEHNLKNISIQIPRDQLVVITGVSGSGKSSLAYNTIYQEGQHRFLDSLSSYARQFLGQMHRPKVKHIDGLSPTLSIDQKTVNRNPRSTVGTITELNAHIRLFFARLGTPHCPVCDKALHALSPETLVNQWLEQDPDKPIIIMAPVVMGRKGEYRKLLIEAFRDGFVRARINGELQKITTDINLARYEKHDIELVIDRTKIQPKNRSRLIQAVETAIAKADFSLSVLIGDQYQLLSAKRSCLEHQFSAPELEPRLFSFNAPQGMCLSCNGLGYLDGFDVNRIIIPNTRVDQCLAPFGERGKIPFTSLDRPTFDTILKKLGISKRTKWEKLEASQQEQLLYGAPISYQTKHVSPDGERTTTRSWDGIMPLLERVWHHTRFKGLLPFRQVHTCSACQGSRLNPIARSVKAYNRKIEDFGGASIQDIQDFFRQIELSHEHQLIGRPIIRELNAKLEFLISVGLDYLSLNRSAATLSGGESQRIRLAAQVGSGLQGVTYVLDEPSIGLHYRDHNRLIDVLHELKNKGNSLLIVEHDPLMMRRADYLIEVGPAAGIEGGEIVAAGNRNAFFKSKALSAQYCRGELGLQQPSMRRPKPDKKLSLSQVNTNNLQNITVELPLERFVVITGVSGSGKSSLIQHSLVPTLQGKLSGDKPNQPLPAHIKGWKQIDKLLIIDQNPIGRNPRSNTATYTGLLTHIRELLALSTEAQVRGYTKSRFSFNVSAENGGGRCEACEGAGENIVEMQFLSNVAITCEHCEGRRFSADTLEITYRQKNIHQILELSIDEALDFFSKQKKIKRILTCLQDVGMGYIKLGQPATTLSGGEAQRIKLATELHRPNTGQTLYVLDEPSTGLHMSDVARLITVLNRLVDVGNSVVVVEHDMDFIRMADWLIDLGPEGGPRGGQICGEGPPEAIAKLDTATGQALKTYFAQTEQKQLLKELQRSYRAKRGKHPNIQLGAVSTHNLRAVDVTFKQGKLNVITGPSGSGKSSLAFHTLFAEGQRRYIESLSTYARRFLGRMQKPPMRSATGLAPAIAIEQLNRGQTPRSTVATTSELHDYLRILYASIARPHCPICQKSLRAHSAFDAAQFLKNNGEETGWFVAPIRGDKRAGIFIQQGHIRLYLKGESKLTDPDALLVDPMIIVDRGTPSKMSIPRLSAAIQTAYDLAGGQVYFIRKADGQISHRFDKELRCPDHGMLLPQELSPRHFSFNTRLGACPKCEGLGRCMDIDFDKLFPDPKKNIWEGMHGWARTAFSRSKRTKAIVKSLFEQFETKLSTPIRKWSDELKEAILNGHTEELTVRFSKRKSFYSEKHFWPGLVPLIDGWTHNADWLRQEGECRSCKGSRLSSSARAYTIDDQNIAEICQLRISEALSFWRHVQLSPTEEAIAKLPLELLLNRLQTFCDVGIGYLNLDRTAKSLSGGESQRLRLATQLGAELTQSIYVLDEPTIGLHVRDTSRLMDILRRLQARANTVVLVEHDLEVIRQADHIIDLGPGAGEHGGLVMGSGSPNRLIQQKTLTGQYLGGTLQIPLPNKRRKAKQWFKLKNICHNNLDNLSVKFPMGCLTVVTGVSGSGKSSLVMGALQSEAIKSLDKPSADHPFARLSIVNQKPIGRTPRSTPATYTGILDPIRKLYAEHPDARALGYTANRFSFNAQDGRCIHCEGRGATLIEMHFLSDIWVHCPICEGARYNESTLEIKYQGYNIAELLQLPCEKAREVLKHHKTIRNRLDALCDVGLGYIRLGQPCVQLSGGEAQRIKLATELAKGSRGKKVLFLLDEPTTGLHPHDIAKLIDSLQRLVESGHSVVVVEHNLDLIKCADHVIDMGPEGGHLGGHIMAEGTPEKIMNEALKNKSATAAALKNIAEDLPNQLGS